MNRRIALVLGALVAPLLLPAPAPVAAQQTDAGNGRLQIVDWTEAGLRAVADGRGGLWTVRQQGIHHRTSERAAEGPRVGLAALGHLAADPRNGDLVYDTFDQQLRRVTIDGEDSLVARDLPGDVTSIDVASDGTIYVAAGPGDIQRIDTDGTRTIAVDTPVYVVALAVAPDGALVYVTEGRLHRWDDGADTVIAGMPAGCGEADPCGDFGPATAARFGSVVLLDVTAAGDIVIGELPGRVRAIVDGIVKPILGGYRRCMYVAPLSCGENGLASLALVDNVVSMSMDGDTLYVVDERPDGRSSRLLRVGAALQSFAPAHQGYRMVAGDGGLFSFGWSPFHGSTGEVALSAPIVGGESNGPGGYWLLGADGRIYTFGNAVGHGSAEGPAVGMSVTAGATYYIVWRDGSVHALGGARHHGDARTGGAVGIATRPDEGGYAVAYEDGHTSRFGPNPPGCDGASRRLNQPIVGLALTASGNGCWLIAADGGVFTFGDAPFFGSTGAMRLNQPVLDLVPTPTGQGYWLIAADGGVFTFGDAQFMGSMGAVRLNRPVLAGIGGP